MRVATNSFANNFLLQLNQLQTQQNRLQTESATGLKLSLPEDDPAAMGQVLNLQTQASANTQYQQNITQLQAAAVSTNTSISSLNTISTRASEIATLANGPVSTQQLGAYAKEVGDLIQQAVQSANTKDSNGKYVFGGTASGSAPFQTVTDANGNATAINYQGDTSVNQTEISEGVTASAQTVGANATGSGPRGLFVDSRYGADLFNHLISLQQNLLAGNKAAISSSDTPALAKDNENILYQVSANGILQAHLSAASNLTTQTGLALTSQISGKTDADMATTLTQLQQTQTAFKAALQSGSMVLNLSVLDYLK